MASGPAVDTVVVDAFEEAIPHVESASHALATAVADAVRADVEGSTAELSGLRRATKVVEGQYKEILDNLQSVSDFYAVQQAQYTSIEAELAALTAIEDAVSKLETTARMLDGKSRELDLAIRSVMG